MSSLTFIKCLTENLLELIVLFKQIKTVKNNAVKTQKLLNLDRLCKCQKRLQEFVLTPNFLRKRSKNLLKQVLILDYNVGLGLLNFGNLCKKCCSNTGSSCLEVWSYLIRKIDKDY